MFGAQKSPGSLPAAGGTAQDPQVSIIITTQQEIESLIDIPWII